MSENLTDQKYRELFIQLPESFYARYRKEQRLGKLFGSVALTRALLRMLAKILPGAFAKTSVIAGNHARTRQFIAMLQRGNAQEAAQFGSSYGYEDDQKELAVAKYYRQQLQERKPGEATESFDLYEHAIAVLSQLLGRDSAIREVHDFGVSYAHVDSVVAEKFPAVRFVGIDRSTLTKQFNEECFSHLPNMSFKAGDILEHLAGDRSGSVLFHMRTSTVLPQHFLETLFDAAHRAKVEYIFGLEPIGVSRQTGTPYRFSDRAQDSVVFRLFMHIHNYPGILKKCGYEVQRIELLKTSHADEDVRYLSFTAKRKN